MDAKVVVMLVGLLFCATQDPPGGKQEPTPPQPPAGAAPLPPVQDPPRTAIERRDLLQRFLPPNPIEGFYRLHAFHAGLGAVARAQGYLAVGQQHLSLHLLAPRAGGPPAIQAAVRQFRISGNQLQMTTLLGIRNDADGDVVIERAGGTRTIGFTLLGTRLRLDLEGGRTLEFERIE